MCMPWLIKSLNLTLKNNKFYYILCYFTFLCILYYTFPSQKNFFVARFPPINFFRSLWSSIVRQLLLQNSTKRFTMIYAHSLQSDNGLDFPISMCIWLHFLCGTFGSMMSYCCYDLFMFLLCFYFFFLLLLL